MRLGNRTIKAVRSHFHPSDRMKRIASIIAFSIQLGPIYVESNVIGDGIEFTNDDWGMEPSEMNDPVEIYGSALADELRDFIDDLPSEVWVECGWNVLESEPEGYATEGEDGEEEWIDVEWDDYERLDQREIVECLFGSLIAEDFR